MPSVNTQFAKFSQAATIKSSVPLIEQVSRLAGITFPKSAESAEKLAQKCLNSVKVKAGLFKTLVPVEFKHSERLDAIARICFFEDWRSYQTFAKNFSRMNFSQRRSSSESVKMILGLLHLSDKARQDPLYKMFVHHIEEFPSGPESRRVLDKFFSAEPLLLSSDRMAGMISRMNRHPQANLMMDFLSTARPLGHKSWQNLNRLSANRLMSSEVVVSESGEVVKASEHLANRMHYTMHRFASKWYPCEFSLFSSEAKIEEAQIQLLQELNLYYTYPRAASAALDILGDFGSKTVFDLITIDDNQSFGGGTGTPEEDARKFDKTLTFMQEVGINQFLSVYRHKSYSDSSDGAVYEVYATIHDSARKLLGYVSLDYVVNKNGDFSSLGLLLDETMNDESLELVMSVSKKVFDEIYQYPDLSKVATVFDWQVSKSHRRLGIGRKLIESIFNIGLSRLGRPTSVFGFLKPISFPVSPAFDLPIDHVGDYQHARDLLIGIWNKTTRDGTHFGKYEVPFYEGGYEPIYHGVTNYFILGTAYFNSIDF